MNTKKRMDIDEFSSIITEKIGETDNMKPQDIVESILEQLSNEFMQDDNWLKDNFQIVYEYNSNCNSCSHIEKRKITEYILSVKRTDLKAFNLDDYLNNICSTQVKKCQNCQRGTSTGGITITSLPQVLLIKIDMEPQQPLVYGTEKVQITTDINAIYDLVTICFKNSSQYDSICKNKTNRNWHLFQSEKADLLSPEAVSKFQPCFLGYSIFTTNDKLQDKNLLRATNRLKNNIQTRLV